MDPSRRQPPPPSLSLSNLQSPLSNPSNYSGIASPYLTPGGSTVYGHPHSLHQHHPHPQVNTPGGGGGHHGTPGHGHGHGHGGGGPSGGWPFSHHHSATSTPMGGFPQLGTATGGSPHTPNSARFQNAGYFSMMQQQTQAQARGQGQQGHGQQVVVGGTPGAVAVGPRTPGTTESQGRSQQQHATSAGVGVGEGEGGGGDQRQQEANHRRQQEEAYFTALIQHGYVPPQQQQSSAQGSPAMNPANYTQSQAQQNAIRIMQQLTPGSVSGPPGRQGHQQQQQYFNPQLQQGQIPTAAAIGAGVNPYPPGHPYHLQYQRLQQAQQQQQQGYQQHQQHQLSQLPPQEQDNNKEPTSGSGSRRPAIPGGQDPSLAGDGLLDRGVVVTAASSGGGGSDDHSKTKRKRKASISVGISDNHNGGFNSANESNTHNNTTTTSTFGSKGKGKADLTGTGSNKAAKFNAEGTPGGTNNQKSGPSDFVKKLCKMLEDKELQHIVCWGDTGDSFVVKDMSEFTKNVLPRHFKHGNFGSFVRQLNKYDFHKVKATEEGSPYGEHTWEFKHINFRSDMRDSLDKIKRKGPTGKKILPLASVPKEEPSNLPVPPPLQRTLLSNPSYLTSSPQLGPPPPPAPSATGPSTSSNVVNAESAAAAFKAFQNQLNSLTTSVHVLTRDYQSLISQMVGYQRNMAAQDQLLQNLIQYLVNLEEAEKKRIEGSDSPPTRAIADTPFVPSNEVQKLISSYSEVARSSFEQMNEISRRAALMPPTPPTGAVHLAPNDPAFLTSISDTESKTSASPLSPIPSSDKTSPASTLSGYPPEPPTQPPMHGSPSHSANRPELQHRPTSSGASHPLQVPTDSFTHPPHEDMSESNQDGVSNSGIDPLTGALANGSTSGLRVYTVGHLKRRDETRSDPVRSLTGSVLPVPNLEQLPPQMPRFDATGMFQDSPSMMMDGGGGGGENPIAKEFESAVADEETDDVPPLPDKNTGERPASKSSGSSDSLPRIRRASSNGSQTLRVRRSTYVPGWAIPPKILLVEDDDVCRKLSSKYLQVFGCTADVAVDGVSAVTKMNLEKYDLVLMDIVMPNLDGVSATHLIRQFDPMTPIISMTSNSNPGEILNYFQNGMTDILPKPFTREGMLEMLEKHLIHLKTVSRAMEQLAQAQSPNSTDPSRTLSVTHEALHAQVEALATSAAPTPPSLHSMQAGGAVGDVGPTDFPSSDAMMSDYLMPEMTDADFSQIMASFLVDPDADGDGEGDSPSNRTESSTGAKITEMDASMDEVKVS